MAISLNNHESRIKALESGKTGGIVTVLWSGDAYTGSISAPISSYDMCFVMLKHDNNRYDSFPIVVPKTLYGNAMTLQQNSCFDTMITVTGSGLYINRNYNNRCRILQIAGLKLYYSFSYNIIYRATHLLEKIFYVLNKGGVSL